MPPPPLPPPALPRPVLAGGMRLLLLPRARPRPREGTMRRRLCMEPLSPLLSSSVASCSSMSSSSSVSSPPSLLVASLSLPPALPVCKSPPGLCTPGSTTVPSSKPGRLSQPLPPPLPPMSSYSMSAEVRRLLAAALLGRLWLPPSGLACRCSCIAACCWCCSLGCKPGSTIGCWTATCPCGGALRCGSSLASSWLPGARGCPPACIAACTLLFARR
mmetsp:Transcript_8801/g.23695  ORF Transcript_8801/g.23695 Transcript_8801/m.23695 type:complete len:217 (+) Transcript_8801:1123-1773(+)